MSNIKLHFSDDMAQDTMAEQNGNRYELYHEFPEDITPEQEASLERWINGQCKIEIDEDGKMTIV